MNALGNVGELLVKQLGTLVLEERCEQLLGLRLQMFCPARPHLDEIEYEVQSPSKLEFGCLTDGEQKRKSLVVRAGTA